MNAREMQYMTSLAADVESEMANFYDKLAHVFGDDERGAQFFRLMALEERSHAQMLRLVQDNLDPSFTVARNAVPRPLRSTEPLEHLRQWIRLMCDLITNSKLDLGWALRVTEELESLEVEAVTNWLLALPVPDGARQIINEVTAGTNDHVARARTFLAQHNQSEHPEAEACSIPS